MTSAAHKASQAAQEWAAKKRDRLERAVAMREERARAAAEAEREDGEEDSPGNKPSGAEASQGQSPWWEKAQNSRSQNGRRSTGQGAVRRKQWNKSPSGNDWQPVAEPDGSSGAGAVLWQRPHEPLDFGCQGRESSHLQEEGPAHDEATAAWLGMLRSEEPAPDPRATKPKPQRRERQGAEQEPTAEGQDEAAKAWKAMLRSESVTLSRAADREPRAELQPRRRSSGGVGRAAAPTVADSLEAMGAAPDEAQRAALSSGGPAGKSSEEEWRGLGIMDHAAPRAAVGVHRQPRAPEQQDPPPQAKQLHLPPVDSGPECQPSARRAARREGTRPRRRSSGPECCSGEPEAGLGPERHHARRLAAHRALPTEAEGGAGHQEEDEARRRRPPSKPRWSGTLDEPARVAVSQQQLDERPVGRAGEARQEEGGGHMGGMANASEDRPWHDGVPVRMQRQPKVPAGQRKPPAAAPMNPEVASSTSVGSGRNSLNRAAPARKAKTDSNTKKGEEDPVTRQMIDKRQSRRDNGPSFTAVIEKYRTGESDIGARLDKGLKKKETGGLLPKDDGLGVPVFVRKRPLFAHEVKKKDYDVVTVDTNNCVVVHNCQMHADLKRMHILHRAFPCTATFSELSTSSEVYSVAAAPLVTAAAYGGQAALFMYGQTGSGKTYTMSTIEKDGLRHLYGELESQGPCTEVRIAVFEISGKKCYDLLQQGHREIFLKETESGAVELLGADEPPAQTADDAFELLAEAKTRRATASTTANATSSRSHCVIRISTLGPSGRGQLTLVDCAGSERNNDSMYHDAQARKEGAEINASLYALRECIRLRRRQSEEARHSGGGKHVHVPYRSSQLTRVLMECFTSPAAQVAVIATVSPSATDTEHTISTLQTALMMAGASSDAYAEVKEDVPLGGAHKPSEVREVKPINWSSKDVRSWLGNLRRGAFKYFAESLPPDINGRALVRMNKAALAQVCAGGNHESGTIIFNEIRNEIDRVDKVLRQQRKGVVDANTRRKSGW